MSSISRYTRIEFQKLLNEKILILDGAMGTMLQKQQFKAIDFGGNKGNNEFLNLTQPYAIEKIHKSYINAGADIIETNTFNGTSISQKEYGKEQYVYDINFRGAHIAKQAASEEKKRRILVAGAIGPTIRSLSLSSDMSKPEYRAVAFDEMVMSYSTQIEGLIDGGADILLLETIYDVLNAKAAIYAIEKIQRNKRTDLPVMVSSTVNDKSGRLLSGHKWDAFLNAICHYPIASFGFNCSFGAEDLAPFVEQLSNYNIGGWRKGIPCGISVYPNAGLPDELGEYTQSPEFMCECLKSLAERGLLNIAGGCCGTTPLHIQAISAAIKGLEPRHFDYAIKGACNLFGKGTFTNCKSLIVSGLETLEINKEKNNFINVGERTNVAGSAKFARLIREKKYSEAANIARKQIEDGATIIDINTDDPMSDGEREMEIFIRYLNSDPEISRAPYMIDSSDWATIKTALRNCGGKSIVNSISLKDGEADFISKAIEIHALGGAVIVMAFDEAGQAATYQRKIDICKRAYDILTEKAGFLPQDIVFDVNVLAVATGMAEHDNYAIDFINAVKWIKENLPGCKTSGGISNLSFSFRGNNTIREAMHSVFLYHAINAGLDMAIVNPSMLQIYDRIDPELLKRTEDVILNKSDKASERLIEFAASLKTDKESETLKIVMRTGSLDDKLSDALIKGDTQYLNEDLHEALKIYSKPVDIIEGPLMKGMSKVGELFASGKMFLPQVVKSAKVMKTAVDILQPDIERFNMENCSDEGIYNNPIELNCKPSRPIYRNKTKIVIATVKGDIHDIGKNIAGIVLSCNNFDVEDLGVMVDNKIIIEEAIARRADIIGVSGLITPSLKQMEDLCLLLEENRESIIKTIGHEIPLIVSGAATSQLHTSVKLAPLYGYCVVYGGDASKTALIAKALTCCGDQQNARTIDNDYIQTIKNEQQKIRNLYNSKSSGKKISIESARESATVFSAESFIQPVGFGENNLKVKNLNLNEILPLMDWTMFFSFWGFKGKYPDILYSGNNAEVENLYEKALEEIGTIIAGEEFDADAMVNFYDACSYNEDIFLLDTARRRVIAVLPTSRQQKEGSKYRSAADYFPRLTEIPENVNETITNQNVKTLQPTSVIGIFALRIIDKKGGEYDHKSFEYLLRYSICAALTEGFAVWIQQQVSAGQNMVRAAFGYPMCPDHGLKRIVFDLLNAYDNLELQLTESNAIIPSTSVCGILITHPEAEYFI